MTRSECLSAALQAVEDRGINYGQPEDNFERIARLWSSYLANKGALAVTSADVALMMTLVKIARLQNQPCHPDSWVDIAGYAACGAEITQSR